MEERTGWRGQIESKIIEEEKRNGRIDGAAETSKERAERRRLQQRNLNILGLLKKRKSGLSATERAAGKYAGAALAKKKEQSRLSRAPDHEGVESQGGREPHLGEREGDQNKSMRRKGWTPQ